VSALPRETTSRLDGLHRQALLNLRARLRSLRREAVRALATEDYEALGKLWPQLVDAREALRAREERLRAHGIDVSDDDDVNEVTP
jgi:hypothetical protein